MSSIRVPLHRILINSEPPALWRLIERYRRDDETSVVIPGQVLIPFLINQIRLKKMKEGKRKWKE